MNLTEKQLELLEHVVLNGQSAWDDGAYCETGIYKPFDVRTIRSLIKRGLVYEIDRPTDRANLPEWPWVLKPTSNGEAEWIRKARPNDVDAYYKEVRACM